MRTLYQRIKVENPLMTLHYFIINRDGCFGVEIFKFPQLGRLERQRAFPLSRDLGEVRRFAQSLVQGQVTPRCLDEIAQDLFFERTCCSACVYRAKSS